MNYQGINTTPEIIAEATKRLNDPSGQFDIYAWPETFASTAGPRPNIGGQALSRFSVVAFVGYGGAAILYCAGVWKKVVGRSVYSISNNMAH